MCRFNPLPGNYPGTFTLFSAIPAHIQPEHSRDMSWLASIGLSLVSAIAGGLIGLAIGLACVSWYSISSFEGKSGYMVGLFILAGLLAGGVVGLVVSRWDTSGADAAFLPTLLRSALVLLTCGATGMLFAWLFSPSAEPSTSSTVITPEEVLTEPEIDPATHLPAADAPLAEWLDVLRYNGNPEIVAKVLKHIIAVPDHAELLRESLLGDDNNAAYSAFTALAQLPAGTLPDAAALMRSSGEDLVEQISEAAALPTADDPGYETAAGVNLRFAGWVNAFRSRPDAERVALLPLLRSMHEVAATRPDSQALADIARTAAHYSATDPG